MKGVIASICPSARLEDLSHDIPPQDVRAAAMFLLGSAPYFPKGTIHVVVVDPGVGTERKPMAAALGGQYVVCPDNGLLAPLTRQVPLEEARHITNASFMLPEISATFHGRDIFSPAAAYLANGRPLEEVGARLEAIELLDWPEPRVIDGATHGEIIHIDHFGNCVSNISRSMCPPPHAARVSTGTRGRNSLSFPRIHATYGAVDEGEALTLFGSSDLLEFAVRNGSAAEQLGIRIGDPVEVRT